VTAHPGPGSRREAAKVARGRVRPGTIAGVDGRTEASTRRPAPWRLVARAVCSVVVVGVLLLLLLNAAYLMGNQCGDSCTDDYTSEGRYVGQLVVAGGGALLGLGAVLAGLRSRGSVYYFLATASAAVLLGWGLWLLSGSF
jgi:hypothetical protein